MPATIETHNLASFLAPELYRAALEKEPSQLTSTTLAAVQSATDSELIALLRGEKGRWREVEVKGTARPWPQSVLADALDQESAVGRDGWFAAPLSPRGAPGEMLVFYRPKKGGTDLLTMVGALAALVYAVLIPVRKRVAQERRIKRLEAILELAAQWNQTHETERLLEQMAETSTRLLGAERASIFIWDRRDKTLVGRPALGVEGGELRIPEDTGVVGQVVHSGQPRRVDIDADQKEIDRQVDKKLGFRTRTLLCVPLRGRKGEMLGAFELINKVNGNFTDDDQEALVELAAHAAIALENTQQIEHLVTSRKEVANEAAGRVQLIGASPAIVALNSTIRRVADTELAVLILGENGTGKEVCSQMVHYLSRRRQEPFIAVNCAALPDTLLESELFGHEKGAFTDAHETRAGKFELASGGTLFLDEIGDMSLSGQAKLLRVLEEKVVVRVGGSRTISTDARVIAATNQDLAGMVRAKKFREDLYYRLNVVSMELPPLRNRGEDIVVLAEHFLQDFSVKARRKAPKFTAAARKRLLTHPWPGNVRELRNLMERLAYLSTGDKIDAEDLAFILAPDDSRSGVFSLDEPLAEATRVFQTQYIKKTIDACRGSMTDAADRLGLHRSNLYRKMRQLGMDPGPE